VCSRLFIVTSTAAEPKAKKNPSMRTCIIKLATGSLSTKYDATIMNNDKNAIYIFARISLWIYTKNHITEVNKITMPVYSDCHTRVYIPLIARVTISIIFPILPAKTQASKKGDIAGYINKGYLHMSIKKRLCPIHRLAWLYIYGEWPELEIDHINGNQLDNRITNLRQVTTRINQTNRKCHREGIRMVGTIYNKKCNNWKSRILVNKKFIWLGTFASAEEANMAYQKKVKEIERT